MTCTRYQKWEEICVRGKSISLDSVTLLSRGAQKEACLLGLMPGKLSAELWEHYFH